MVEKTKRGGEKLGFGELGHGGKKKTMGQGGRSWWLDMLAYHRRDGCHLVGKQFRIKSQLCWIHENDYTI